MSSANITIPQHLKNGISDYAEFLPEGCQMRQRVLSSETVQKPKVMQQTLQMHDDWLSLLAFYCLSSYKETSL